MRYLLVVSLFFILDVQAQTYKEVMLAVTNSLTLKSARQLEKAAYKNYDSIWDTQLPTLDASLSYAHLNETPTMTFYLPGVPPQHAPMGTKDRYTGELVLRYPLFTGFAQSAQVESAKLEAQKASLQVADLKRNLYLKASELYGAVLALDNAIEAQRDAKEALHSSYEKAKGLNEAGMLGDADLYNIEAKFYEIESTITELRSQRTKALANISYLVNEPVESCEPLGQYDLLLDKGVLIESAKQREDIRALGSAMGIAQSRVTLAQSRYFPAIGIAASLKHHGNTIELDGDGYMNAGQSYIGAEAKWNLFSGLSDKRRIEAAKLQVLSAKTKLTDYTIRVLTDLNTSFQQLEALVIKRKSAVAQQKAQQAYYDLTRGRFDNQLAGADELSRATADLAGANAQISTIDARRFIMKAKILLQSGLESFSKVIVVN